MPYRFLSVRRTSRLIHIPIVTRFSAASWMVQQEVVLSSGLAHPISLWSASPLMERNYALR
jgi:hypothetical protein